MGSWGTGLYDSDVALDKMDGLADTLDPTVRPARLAGNVGLLARFSPSTLIGGLEEGPAWAELMSNSPQARALPGNARAVLRRIVESPESTLFPGARLAEHSELLGGYCDGPHFEELLGAPRADAVIAEFAERAMACLDVIPTNEDLHYYHGELAPLGLVLELDVPTDLDRLLGWESRFELLDAKTDCQRDFWDEYSGKVRRIFNLLRSRD